jgi:CRP/FNR family transcriptional regulator
MEVIENHSFCQFCGFKSRLFTRLSEEELVYINGFKTEYIFEKGEVIIQQGRPIKEFLYLKTGLVKLHFLGKSQKDRIISIARPLDFVSLLSTFSNTEYPFSITALEKSIVCSINLDAIRQIIQKNGNFALELLEQVSRSSHFVLQSTYDIDEKNLRGRIAYILLWFSRKIYHKDKFDLPISRKEVGELINMTTENVIRILSEYRKDGILNIGGKTIEILDPDFLERICKWG